MLSVPRACGAILVEALPDAAELEARHEVSQGDLMSFLDLDKDGLVSLEEALEMVTHVWRGSETGPVPGPRPTGREEVSLAGCPVVMYARCSVSSRTPRCRKE